MELEELQAVWSEMTDQLEKQKKLTHKLIMEMTQQKYSRKFQKFFNYESMGALICLVAAVFLLFNFYKLDTWYLQLLGLLALAFLIGLPIMVLTALYRIKNLNIIEGSYKDTLLDYARAKKNLLRVQRLGINASYLFAFISLPLAGKLLRNKDYFQESLTWLWYLPLFLIFLFLVSRWAFKCYQSATDKAEDLIRDLN